MRLPFVYHFYPGFEGNKLPHAFYGVRPTMSSPAILL